MVCLSFVASQRSARPFSAALRRWVPPGLSLLIVEQPSSSTVSPSEWPRLAAVEVHLHSTAVYASVDLQGVTGHHCAISAFELSQKHRLQGVSQAGWHASAGSPSASTVRFCLRRRRTLKIELTTSSVAFLRVS